MGSKRLGWLSCMLIGVVTWGGSASLASDEGMEAAEQVSQTNYYNLLNNYLYTHNGHNRGRTGAQHNLARDNILALFQSYGLSAQIEVFVHTYTGYNVVATQLGTVFPERIYIIGAHYDSANNPGADDDASGVAAVLEAARILSQYESECTIRYIAFDLEELGLYGSQEYVEAHGSEDIRGMISLDMIAYDPGTNRCNIYGRTASNPIKNALAAAVAEYGNGLTSSLGGDTPYSDHAPFEAAGFQACLFCEGEIWNNPYYHTQQDSFDMPGYLNFPYAVKLVRSVTGWLVDHAVVHVNVNGLAFSFPEGRPDYTAPNGSTTILVEVVGVGTETPVPGSGTLHYNLGQGWQAVPMTEIADGLYEAHMPAATCGSEVDYYFSALGTSGSTYTYPRQAPTTYLTATAAYGIDAFYVNPLSTNPGWSTEGLWAFGQPTGGGGQYGGPDPTSGYTGPYVYGYNLNGDYENNLPERHLTSTPINCSGKAGVKLGFWRWLGVEQPAYDHAYVRVSNNGSNWTTVWSNPTEIADTSWHYMELDISAVADDRPNVYLRWTMGTTDVGWRYCGWNIDDIQLTQLICEPPFTVGDMDCDGDVDFDDIDPFVLALQGQAAYEALYPDCFWLNADTDGDGDVDFDDIDPFVTLLGS